MWCARWWFDAPALDVEIGPDGEQDSGEGAYIGPIQAKYAGPYGDNVPIIEVRAGGTVALTLSARICAATLV